MDKLLSVSFIKAKALSYIVTLVIGIFPISLFAQVSWERVYEGILSHDTLAGFYSGGFERNKQVLVDIDADSDLDFFIGMWDGTVMFYENIGDAQHPKFKFITEEFGGINVRGTMTKGYAAPEFVDIDNDGDYDCFSGDYLGNVHFYENVGTAQSCSFALVDSHMFNPILYRHSNLAFCDIDRDGDFDMWVGAEEGRNGYYPNIGTADSFCFDSLDTEWFCTNMGYQQIDPTFCDINNDNDYDLFYGEMRGRMVYWRNDGDSANYNFTHITDSLVVPCTYNRGGGFFADIDGDGDFDLFLGGKDGLNRFCKNMGTQNSAVFDLITEHYLYIDFDMYSCPTFCDIDGDWDMDMFVGDDDLRAGGAKPGRIRLCRNVGDTLHPAWVYETREFGGIITPSCPAPAFADIDGDKDMELFIGTSDGKIIFYRNVGTPSAPSWIYITDNFATIDVGEHSKPAFSDIDADLDYDLFIGNRLGEILLFMNNGNPSNYAFNSLPDTSIDSVEAYSAPTLGDVDLDGDFDIIVGMSDAIGLRNGYLRFYRNDGDSASPVWVIADSAMYDSMDVGRLSAPALTDIDNDGDLDLFVGEGDGGINYWRNGLIGVEDYKIRRLEDCRWEIYPNPFTTKTFIEFKGLRVQEFKDFQLQIYNLAGRLVKDYKLQIPDSRLSQIPLTADDLAVGVYFCKLKVGNWTSTKKLVHIR